MSLYKYSTIIDIAVLLQVLDCFVEQSNRMMKVSKRHITIPTKKSTYPIRCVIMIYTKPSYAVLCTTRPFTANHTQSPKSPKLF